MRSVRYVIFGLLLVVAATALLFWNEARAVASADALAEGAGRVESVGTAAIDPRHEAKLVHFTGKTTSGQDLHDPDLGIVTGGLRLSRKVEMFQWKEETRGRGGGSSESNFSYTRAWSEEPIDWTRFRFPQDHRNPPMPSLGFSEFVADDVRVGAFRIAPRLTAMLGPGQAFNVPPLAVEHARERLGQPGQSNPSQSIPSQSIQGGIFVGDEAGAPRVGDVRITYLLLPHQSVTIVGRQSGDGIAPYRASNGNEILLVRPGQEDAGEVFQFAQDGNVVLTWSLRVLGVLIIYLACRVILRPMQIMGSYVPLLGSVSAVGIPTLSLLLTLVLAPFIIGVAWMFQRPLLGLPALAAAALLGWFTVSRFRHAKPGAVAR